VGVLNPWETRGKTHRNHGKTMGKPWFKRLKMKNDEFKKEKLGLFQSQINELHAVGSIRSSKWLTMTNGQY